MAAGSDSTLCKIEDVIEAVHGITADGSGGNSDTYTKARF